MTDLLTPLIVWALGNAEKYTSIAISCARAVRTAYPLPSTAYCLFCPYFCSNSSGGIPIVFFYS